MRLSLSACPRRGTCAEDNTTIPHGVFSTKISHAFRPLPLKVWPAEFGVDKPKLSRTTWLAREALPTSDEQSLYARILHLLHQIPNNSLLGTTRMASRSWGQRRRRFVIRENQDGQIVVFPARTTTRGLRLIGPRREQITLLRAIDCLSEEAIEGWLLWPRLLVSFGYHASSSPIRLRCCPVPNGAVTVIAGPSRLFY